MEISNNDIRYTKALEGYLKDLGEKSYCYSYLHKKAEALYSKKATKIDLPVIILSTLSGTLSIGNSAIFGVYEKEANMGIGVLSIFVSILNTIGTYFCFSKRAENHRLNHIQYGKLHRFLEIELKLCRKERMNPNDLLKVVREQYERLDEISPLIPQKILNRFQNKYLWYR